MSRKLIMAALALGLCTGMTGVQATDTNAFTVTQAISDQAQRTTLAFDGLAMLAGNLDAQSFFPPGKVADYTGFQYLRDNDPSGMGHNTSFMTRVANNVLYILTDSQLAQLQALATNQVTQINLYGYKRYPLMQAFRRLMDGTAPTGASGLNLVAIKAASKELYLIDGQISYDRAVLYADIFRSLSTTQKAYLDAMKGKGWSAWPNIPDELVRDKTRGLSQTAVVAVMTYAGDLFSWYAGSVNADVYFCPERHGTYFGSFYLKDAPAVGHEGYSISTTLTAQGGAALCDSSKGYVTANQAALFSSLVDIQRANLYAGTNNIVKLRTEISTALRSLISSTAPTDAVKAQVKALVLAKSGSYGELDGENVYHYATVFHLLAQSLTASQKANLIALRNSFLCGTYADGTAFDFSSCTTPFLYSGIITDTTLLASYIANTDYLFSFAPEADFGANLTSGTVPLTVTFTNLSTGTITNRLWSFGDGGHSYDLNPAHVYTKAGTFSVGLVVVGPGGIDALVRTNYVTVTAQDITPPVLTITSPKDNQLFKTANITVTGTVSDASGIKSVKVNGFTARLAGSSWSCSLALRPGTNLITVSAADNSPRSNSTTKTVRAVFSSTGR